MNIWLLNHYASSQFRNRAGRHYWFAKQLKDLGHDVTVFCSNTFLIDDEVIETDSHKCKIEYVDDIPFVFVKTMPYKGNGIDRILNMSMFYKNLFPSARYYKKGNGSPDVILASSVHPLTMVAGIQIAKKWGIPCICEVRDLWPEAIFSFGVAKENSPLGWGLVKGEHWIYKNADALIFTKEGDTDYLKERKWTTAQGGDIALSKCHYINNGIDLSYVDRNVRSMEINDIDVQSEDKFKVIYTGTLRPMNDVGKILDAAKIIRKNSKYDDISFLIFGDGIQFNQLKRRVMEEELINVKLKGKVERKYIPYILSKSELNLLNYSQSKYNWTRGNSSNKLFEYMASGKPIISTVHMGYSIIRKYDCGVELDEDTPEALAREIMRFHDMKPEEREQIGQNAREGAKNFDFKVLTDKLVKVIEEVV